MPRRSRLLGAWLMLGSLLIYACNALNGVDDLGVGDPRALPPTEAGGLPEKDASLADTATPIADAKLETATPDAAMPSPYATAVLADGPLGYWRLGEKSGAIAADVTGKTPGSYMSVTLGAPGAIAGDTAISLTLGQVILGTGFSFPGHAAYTLEAWILPQLMDGATRRFLGRKDASETGYTMGVRAPEGAYFFRKLSGVNVPVPPTAPVSLVAFNHVVGTYDGATLTLYVNGVAVTSAADARDMPLVDATAFIGSDLSPTMDFQGSIDEVAIYDKALSPARVKAHFDASVKSN